MHPNRTAAVLLAAGALLLGTAPVASAAEPTKPRIGRYKVVPCKTSTGVHQTPLMACLKRVGNQPVPFGR